MPDQSGIAAVTASGKLEEFGKAGGFGVEPAERRPGASVVETPRGDEPSVRKPEELGAANPDSEVLPGPVAVGRPGHSQLPGSRLSVASEETEAGAVREIGKTRLVGVGIRKQGWDLRVEAPSVPTGVQPDEAFPVGVIPHAEGLGPAPGHAPHPDVGIPDGSFLRPLASIR